MSFIESAFGILILILSIGLTVTLIMGRKETFQRTDRDNCILPFAFLDIALEEFLIESFRYRGVFLVSDGNASDNGRETHIFGEGL